MAENKINEEELTSDSSGPEDLTDSKSDQQSEESSKSKDVEADPLDEARQEIGELKDKYLRLYAEFENFRRRTSKERIELISTANAGLLKSLLPILDDFERARAAFEGHGPEVEPLKEGVELIYSKFLRTLESEGLKPMEAQGEPFNADFHESVAQFPAANEEQKGKIIDVLEKGYYLNDKVIRYAKVVVGV
ncbi:MAG: nucleotide exchange factor GrpE [Cytophagaceae bacterium SCN 52-12]|nr:MAG: nucleotide exchange factor GrpE [Cytophagaceae bacterium SCN 52-12]